MVPQQLKRSPGSPSSSGEEGPFPCFAIEGILSFPSHLKRRQSPLDARDELEVSSHHFKRLPKSQGTPDTPDSHALTLRSPRGATANTMEGVTALWHLERKPPIPKVNLTGGGTLLFKLEKRMNFYGSTRDES